MSAERILLITSRSLDPHHAWGIAARQWLLQGHRIVAVTDASSTASFEHSTQTSVVRMPSNIRNLPRRTLAVSAESLGDYERYRVSPDFASTHSTLLLMMSRVDSTGSFRGLEREVLAREIHLEIFGALRTSSPTVAVFDVTPHEAFDYALLKVLEWKKIPTLMFQPSLVGPQVMARTSISEILSVPFPGRTSDDHAFAQAGVIDISLAALARLRAGTGTPKMDSQKKKELQATSFVSRLRAIRFFLHRLRTPGRDVDFSLTGHEGIPVLMRRFLEIFFERSLRRSLRAKVAGLANLVEPPQHRYAFLALHYEPERSSIPEGFPFDSQLDAIIAARCLLPDDVELLVKEHFSQQGAALRGFVGRSPDFYDVVGALPGVRVLGIRSETRLLMQHAECVMTLTGKVGIEAVGEGTPVLYLGQPWWPGMPGTAHISQVSDFEEFLRAHSPQADAVDAWLEHQVRDVLLPGVSSVPPERYSARIAPLPDGFDGLEAGGIVAAFDALRARP